MRNRLIFGADRQSFGNRQVGPPIILELILISDTNMALLNKRLRYPNVVTVRLPNVKLQNKHRSIRRNILDSANEVIKITLHVATLDRLKRVRHTKIVEAHRLVVRNIEQNGLVSLVVARVPVLNITRRRPVDVTIQASRLIREAWHVPILHIPFHICERYRRVRGPHIVVELVAELVRVWPIMHLCHG